LHIVAAISYYTLDGFDPRRFSITAPTNFFQLLDRDTGGLPETLVREIEEDTRILDFKEFTFIDIPVLGKFDIFSFSLDIDIPIFALRTRTGSSLSGIGISRNMLKYYNAQFAGTHVLFPVFDDEMILGKKVSLVFWASKLFSIPEDRGRLYESEISHIDTDYPGFWVVIPYSIARDALSRYDKELARPYKIIGYMDHSERRAEISGEYRGYDLQFDEDTIAEKKSTFRTLASILFIIAGTVVAILYAFLFLVFLGYFREKSEIYILSDLYKIPRVWRYILLYSEPFFLVWLSLIITWSMIALVEPYILSLVIEYLTAKNIFFPITRLSGETIFFLIAWNTLFLFLILLMSSRRR
jgi:hypothetical protein